MLCKQQQVSLNHDIAQLKVKIDEVEQCKYFSDSEKFGIVSAHYFFIVNGYSCTKSGSKRTLEDIQPLTNLLDVYANKLFHGE